MSASFESSTQRAETGPRPAPATTAAAEPGAVEREALRLRRAADDLEGLFVTQLVRASRMASAPLFGRVPGGGVLQGLAEDALGAALAGSADFGIAGSLLAGLAGDAGPGQSARPTRATRAHTSGRAAASSPAARAAPRAATPPAPAPHAPRETPLAAAQVAPADEPRAAAIGAPSGVAESTDERAAASADATAATGAAAPGASEPARPASHPRAGRPERIRERLAPFADAIAEAASRFGVDADLIRAVIVQESGGNPHARSPRGARGLMQIIPTTGRALGLERPFDPRENILAGARYLAEMLDRHAGDLPLALASYNAGPGAVRRHGGIPPFRETMGYVAGVLSLAKSLREDRERAAEDLR